MCYLFRVIVPFVAVTRETLAQSIAARLPPGETSLPGMLVRETSDGSYTVTVEAEAETPSAAKESGVLAAEQLLKLLAVSNDLFEVEFSSVMAENLREINPTEPAVARESDKVTVAIQSTVFLSEHLGLVKTKGSLKFESKALTDIDKWPDHLRRGIDLNYSAVRAATNDVRFLLLASALEILVWKKLGAPESLLKSKFSVKKIPPMRTQRSSEHRPIWAGLLAFARRLLSLSRLVSYKTFVVSFEAFLKCWGFNNEEVSRLRNQLLTTNKEPVARHLVGYLESVGLQDYTVPEVATWWRIRGKIAHGESADSEQLKQAVSRISQAVQNTLRVELSHL